MTRKFRIVMTLIASGVLAPAATSASELPRGGWIASRSLIEQAQFLDVDRCRVWRRDCAGRWGWNTERFYRCLARYGCERHRYNDGYDR